MTKWVKRIVMVRVGSAQKIKRKKPSRRTSSPFGLGRMSTGFKMPRNPWG